MISKLPQEAFTQMKDQIQSSQVFRNKKKIKKTEYPTEHKSLKWNKYRYFSFENDFRFNKMIYYSNDRFDIILFE